MDLIEHFTGVVQERVYVPAPHGLVPEGPAGAAGALGLALFAEQPVGESSEDVALCGVWSLVGG
ncbi:hypothetical protein JOF39_002872 [Glutamicibacter protophormiae]|uniref:Uncharacterized protein n=1 Tax=Glutamicibacter protophormiae TaxID=37930 RepID=A0ABS4XTF3_GLUPR|nr:hypothetical protein [Glutamicibacter protophormiae]